MSDTVKVIVEREDLVALADSVRAKAGTTAQMNMGELKTAVDGIATATAPTISVSSGGLITATAGDKSTTKQLTTQAAKTITPSTSSQTAVASGKYTTGAITVGAIPSNYVAPSGSLDITENGTFDVKNYANAVVNVAGSGGGSGGGSVETYSAVNIDLSGISMSAVYSVTYMKYTPDYGVEIIATLEISPQMTLENVIKKSMICFETGGYVGFMGDVLFSVGDMGNATTVGLLPNRDSITMDGFDVV